MALSGRFHHMDIYVGDLDRTVTFWAPLFDAIGWHTNVERPTVKSWTNGETELFFVQSETEFVAQGYHRKRVGLNHYAFSVNDRAGLEQLRARVVAQGARMLYGGDIEDTPTQHRFFFEDPDRIKIEVLAPRG